MDQPKKPGKARHLDAVFYEYMPATFDQPTLFDDAQMDKMRAAARKIWLSAFGLITFLIIEAAIFYLILKSTHNL